jgi:LEA14-like dessication related protein
MRSLTGARALRCGPPAALAALLATGCLFAPKLETPELSIVGLQLQGSTIWEQHLRVRMHVHNPNDRALPVKSLDYTLEVAGQEFASGESAAAFVVPALGDAEFDVSVTTNMAGALINLIGRSDALKDNVPYRLSGKISLSQGWLRSIPFDQQGSFRLQ